MDAAEVRVAAAEELKRVVREAKGARIAAKCRASNGTSPKQPPLFEIVVNL